MLSWRTLDLRAVSRAAGPHDDCPGPGEPCPICNVSDPPQFPPDFVSRPEQRETTEQTRDRLPRESISPTDLSDVKDVRPRGGTLRPQHDDLQIFEFVRPSVQGKDLKNPPKHQVTKREEHGPPALPDSRPILRISSFAALRQACKANTVSGLMHPSGSTGRPLPRSINASGHINLSPKGLDSLRILGPHTIAYLDYVGSGAETIAHLSGDPRGQ